MLGLPARIEAKISPEPNTGCWLWTGAGVSNGYGYCFTADLGKSKLAHRVVFERLRGPIPAGLKLDHLCRVRACVNPDHLEIVTHKTNTLRGEGLTARYARSARCKHGHQYTLENTIMRIKSGNITRRCRTCRDLANKARFGKGI